MISLAATWISSALAILVLLHGAWWCLLALIAVRRPRASHASGEPPVRFAVIVPAHNEERMVGDTVRSLLAAPYAPRPQLLVVADNCTDATAAEAMRAGATVLVRTDPERRGKNFALDYALAHLRKQGSAPDAIAFVDADSTVSPSFFFAIASRLSSGAAAVQVHYAVTEATAPLVRLRSLAFALVHWARPLGAARLGLGTTLKGNGMALRWDLVRDGFVGAGITEDAAATLALARSGVAVRFEPRATVWGHMAASYSAAAVQDSRWESGRFALVKPAFSVAVSALLRRHVAAAAGALEVASLPLSSLAMAAIAALVIAVIGGVSVLLPLAALASLACYVALGWSAARVPPRQLSALASVPGFLAFKLGVFGAIVLRRGPAGWQRTSRADLP